VPVLVELRRDRALAALRHLDVVAPAVIALLLHDDLVDAGVDRALPARGSDGLTVDLDGRALRTGDDEELALLLVRRELKREVERIRAPHHDALGGGDEALRLCGELMRLGR